MLKRQFIVPVGEYCVSKDQQIELITVVGSCVAVTLYDKQNQIGGLVHIVLPGKRNHLREHENKAYYADSGVPLLFEELKELGSKTENFVASVIGGASTHAEHEENTIGRKNAITAITLLKNYGIPLSKVDIGGRCGRRIILSIDNGNLSIQNSTQQAVSYVLHHEEGLDKIKFDFLIKKIEGLKPDENVAGELLEVVHDRESTTDDLQKIISKDFILVCQIFRLCNSSYYGFPGRISSVHDAVRLLGNRKFRLISVVVGTMRQRHKMSQNIIRFTKKLSWHAYGTALIAEHLSFKSFPEYKDEAYTAGLLHNIGNLGTVILQADTSFNKRVNSPLASYLGNPSLIAEQILEKWKMPGKIVRAVTKFETPSKEWAEKEKLTGIIHVAYKISQLLGLGLQTNMCVDRISSDIMGMLNLPEKLEPIMPGIISTLQSAGILSKCGQKMEHSRNYESQF